MSFMKLGIGAAALDLGHVDACVLPELDALADALDLIADADLRRARRSLGVLRADGVVVLPASVCHQLAHRRLLLAFFSSSSSFTPSRYRAFSARMSGSSESFVGTGRGGGA